MRESRAPLFPSLTATGGASRSQGNSAGAGFNAGSFIVDRYSAGLDAQWELDVWGRIRAGVTASRRNADAIAADYAAARQSIAAQTAQAYFTLVSETQLLALTQRRLKSFQDTFALVDRRYEAGLTGFSEASLARTDVETTRAQLSERTNARDQAARALAVLTGSYPTKSSVAKSFPSLSRGVPTGVPSSLLRDRPDLNAAYLRILAADANVTVAHAALFPSFSLTGSAGRQSARLSDLARAGFDVWSLGAGLTAPIVDGGRLRAQLGAANARTRQAVARYEATALNALREVEDALGSETFLREREDSTRQALKAAKNAEEGVRRSYENGLVEILTLLDAQRRAFSTEESLITIRTLRYQNRVSLALALGKAL